jgi:flagellar assembly factor FliW
MVITLMLDMFGPFDVRISYLSVLKILLFDKVIIYCVVTVNTPMIELTAALDWSMVTIFVINSALTPERDTIDDA